MEKPASLLRREISGHLVYKTSYIFLEFYSINVCAIARLGEEIIVEVLNPRMPYVCSEMVNHGII
jgi:hypothetical protein